MCRAWVQVAVHCRGACAALPQLSSMQACRDVARLRPHCETPPSKGHVPAAGGASSAARWRPHLRQRSSCQVVHDILLAVLPAQLAVHHLKLTQAAAHGRGGKGV